MRALRKQSRAFLLTNVKKPAVRAVSDAWCDYTPYGFFSVFGVHLQCQTIAKYPKRTNAILNHRSRRSSLLCDDRSWSKLFFRKREAHMREAFECRLLKREVADDYRDRMVNAGLKRKRSKVGQELLVGVFPAQSCIVVF